MSTPSTKPPQEFYFIEHVRESVSLPDGFSPNKFNGLHEVWTKAPTAREEPSIVSVWESKALYDTYAIDYRNAVGALEQRESGPIIKLARSRASLVSVKVIYPVLMAIVGLIGGLIALREYFDFFWESPSIGIYLESPLPTGDSETRLLVPVQKQQVITWRVLNHGRSQPARIMRVSANANPANEQVVVHLNSADHIPKLAVGEYQAVSATVESRAAIETELFLELDAKAGVFSRVPERIKSKPLKISAWSQVLFAKRPSFIASSDNGRTADFRAEIGFGKGGQQGRRYALQVLRHPGIHFLSLQSPLHDLKAEVPGMSENQTPGSEVASIVFVAPDVPALSTLSVLFSLASDRSRQETEWKQIAAGVLITE